MPSFCRVLPNTFHGGSKHFEPLDPCDLKLLGKVLLRYMWSPSVFRDNQRSAANFSYSDFVGLDVDNGNGEIYTLEQAVNDWSDSECIIATTRNHMKEKTTGTISITHPPVPRFRIITRWESRITDARIYQHTLRTFLKTNPQYDKACCDTARMFYPCKEIVFENYDGYRQPVLELPEIARDPRLEKLATTKKGLDPAVEQFLRTGKTFGGGRNVSVYVSTLTLLRAGYLAEKTLELIEKSPFSRQQFSEYELLRSYNNGLQTFLTESEQEKIG